MSRTLATFLRSVGAGRSRAAHPVRRWFRPTLEHLEDRVVPDAMVWKGTTSTSWNNMANWYDTTPTPAAVATWVPGSAGHTTDTVTFDGTAAANCSMNVSVTVAGLTLAGGTGAFTKTLTITTGNYGVVQGGPFEFDGGTFNFASGTHLDLDTTGDSNWKGGDFSSGSSGGTVYVFHSSTTGSSTLNILADAQKLGASLVIGESPTSSDSTAALNVSNATAGMSGNVTLYQNATITNYALGTIYFNQSVNCDTKGGIVLDAGSTNSAITNKGTINRTVVNTSSNVPANQLKVLAPITQQDNDSALFNLGAGCWLYLNVPARGRTPDLTVNRGVLQYGKGSGLVAKIELARAAKKIELATTGGTGAVNFYVNGDLTTDGAAIAFDYTAGAWGVLNVSGNLTVAGGTAVAVNVDGNTSGTSDTISVGGTTTLTSGAVNVTAQNASAPLGNAYTVLTSSSGISGTWGSSPTNAGSNSDNWFWGSANQGVLYCGTVPAVTGISPSSGSTLGGTSITISGSGFTNGSSVEFGGVAATSFTVNTDSSITAVAPAHMAGTIDITVTTSGGTSATLSADHFTYITPPAPVVTGVSPSSGSYMGGTSVTISGSNFTGAGSVLFGGLAATSFTVNTDGSITAVAPAHFVGTVDITVTTSSGTSATSSADDFTYTAPPAPVVTGVSPSSGSYMGGTSVTISGSNFTGAGSVLFGGLAATSFTVNTDGSITAVAPAHFVGTVDITVTTSSGTSATSSADDFTYT